MRSRSSASVTSNVRSSSGSTAIASTSSTARASIELNVVPSGEMSKLGQDLARHHLGHLLEGRPDLLGDRGYGTACPSTSLRTIATRPERITYIGGTGSPTRLRNSPVENRRISPNRRTRSISARERTGNIWL